MGKISRELYVTLVPDAHFVDAFRRVFYIFDCTVEHYNLYDFLSFYGSES